MSARDERGARIIHVDPRFTRTSAVADIWAPIRAGTDVAFFGGLINYILENELYHEDYVKLHTNASFMVRRGLRVQRRPVLGLRRGQAHATTPPRGTTSARRSRPRVRRPRRPG